MSGRKGFGFAKPETTAKDGKAEKIFTMFRNDGFEIPYREISMLSPDICLKHYKKDPDWFLKKGTRRVEDRGKLGLDTSRTPEWYGKQILEQVIASVTAGPIEFFVAVRDDAVSRGLQLVGGTEPATNEDGTIRKILCMEIFGFLYTYAMAEEQGIAIPTMLHWSDSDPAAEREGLLHIKKHWLKL